MTLRLQERGALSRAVARAAARRADAVERCGLCAVPVPEQHRHVLDEHDRTVLCACTACSLLFSRDAAGGDRYRLVPTERARLSGLDVDVLDVPVGLAFFVKQSDGRVLAHYPSPLGTTETEVAPEAWRSVEAQSSVLARMRPQVQALLVRASDVRGAEEHWVLPVDDCFRLVAVVRRHWAGMSGGSAVWREIARFFAELARPPGRHTGSDSERRWSGWQGSGSASPT